jgi:hypothetical protein
VQRDYQCRAEDTNSGNQQAEQSLDYPQRANSLPERATLRVCGKPINQADQGDQDPDNNHHDIPGQSGALPLKAINSPVFLGKRRFSTKIDFHGTPENPCVMQNDSLGYEPKMVGSIEHYKYFSAEKFRETLISEFCVTFGRFDYGCPCHALAREEYTSHTCLGFTSNIVITTNLPAVAIPTRRRRDLGTGHNLIRHPCAAVHTNRRRGEVSGSQKRGAERQRDFSASNPVLVSRRN